MDVGHYQIADVQSIYRLLMIKDRETLLRIFLLSEEPHEDTLTGQEWEKVQFYWKSIIIAASLQANIQRYTPMTMAQIFSLLAAIDDMEASQFNAGAHFLTDKMLALYASGMEEFDNISNPHVAKCVRLIHSQVKSPDLSLNTIAKKLNISSPYLSSIFQKEMEMTLITYIHKVKIEASLDHLKFTNHPVQQIAKEYGYSSITTYGRKFKEIMGTTPLKYRKSNGI